MAGRLREHLRGNVVGYVAMFFALGFGSAWAAGELGRNSVKSKHIAKGQVKRSDVARRAIDSSKVRDGSLKGTDFAPGQLPQGPQGERGPRGEAGPSGPSGPSGILDAVGRSTASTAGCVPGALDTVPDPLECVRVTLPLDRDARVFVSASVDWGVYGGRYAGECRLTADGAPIPGGPVAHPGEYDLEDQGAAQPYPGDLDFGVFTGVDYLSQLSLSHVAGPFAPGDHDFGLLCGNEAGAMRFKNPSISAVAISSE